MLPAAKQLLWGGVVRALSSARWREVPWALVAACAVPLAMIVVGVWALTP